MNCPAPSATWERLTLAGQTVEVLDPPEAVEGRALLILPGWNGRAGDVESLTHWLVTAKLRAIAPIAGTWWLDKVESQFSKELSPLSFLQEHLLPWIETQWETTPPNIRLLGWEEGGQGILQLAFRRPREFPTLAAIDAAIDFHELHGHDPVITDLFRNWEAARQETALLRLHPAGWPRRMLLVAERDGRWFEGVDRLEMKLSSSGIPVAAVFYPAKDFPTVTERASAMQYALEHLTRESMALPVVGREHR